MQFNTSVLTNGKKYDLDKVAGAINKIANKAADYIVGLDPEIDFSDAQASISRATLEHLVGRIRSLPTDHIVYGWGEMPAELSIVVDVKEIDPKKYDLTITESRGKTDTWSLEIQEFTGGSVEYIALRKLMKEYGFKNPTTPLRKYRVMLMGKEASLTGPELCRFEKDLIASGSLARPLFEPVSEEANKELDLGRAWKRLCKLVHHAFEYGLHCNDMTMGEVEEDIAFAIDEFGKTAGYPEYDWEADYNEVYSAEEN